MFNRIHPELNKYALSFLSDYELFSCALVSKSAKDIVTTILKGRMKDYSIGRERFKAICLMNTELAKFGIDVDSARERYHLLVNDINDIASMNEEVAKHILENAKLRRVNRLNRDFSFLVCIKFPTLAVQLFSTENISRPNAEEIVEIITNHPDLFNKLYTNQKFISTINKAEIINSLALINESIALVLCNDSNKFGKKFDKDWFLSVVGGTYESVAIKILENPAYKDQLYDDNLFILGKNHVVVAQLIVENISYSKKLNDLQLIFLVNKSKENIKKVTSVLLANENDFESMFHYFPKEIVFSILKDYSMISNKSTFFSQSKNEMIKQPTIIESTIKPSLF